MSMFHTSLQISILKISFAFWVPSIIDIPVWEPWHSELLGSSPVVLVEAIVTILKSTHFNGFHATAQPTNPETPHADSPSPSWLQMVRISFPTFCSQRAKKTTRSLPAASCRTHTHTALQPFNSETQRACLVNVMLTLPRGKCSTPHVTIVLTQDLRPHITCLQHLVFTPHMSVCNI